MGVSSELDKDILCDKPNKFIHCTDTMVELSNIFGRTELTWLTISP